MNLNAQRLKNSYNKRIYLYPAFRQDVRQIFDNIEDLRRAAMEGRVSKPFAEKIMLVVTAVNRCRYCSFGHSRAALAAGVPETELQNLLALDLRTFPENEVMALTFAQHYADSGSCPDPAAWERLVEYYGDHTAQDILIYLRMITFGNLVGNTFDALLSRFSGKPAPGSSLRNELSVLVGVLWMPAWRLLLRILNCSRMMRKVNPEPSPRTN